MARPWARWLRPATTGVIIVAALTIAGQAVLAAIALPHLIRLDLGINAAIRARFPDYSSHGATYWPSPRETVITEAACAALVLAWATWTHSATGKIHSWLDRADRGQGMLLWPFLHVWVLGFVAYILDFQRGIDYDLFDPSSVTNGELAALKGIVENFHADRFNDLRYYLWYPGAANTLTRAMGLLIVVTGLIALASAAHEWAIQASEDLP
jgi:hypothetical protein